MSSRRFPSTVYTSKRRQRSISNPHHRPVPSSSPPKPLANDADISVEEMSRRMMKRSRSGLKRSFTGSDSFKSASVGASPVDRSLEETRPTKRSKASVRIPLQTIVEPGGNTPAEEEGTVDMDLTEVVELKTPVPRENPIGKQNDTEMKEESDFLSPLPSSRLAKRVIAHRTSSSSLTENKVKKKDPSGNCMLLSPASSDLASPFHSRPGSPSPNRHVVKNTLKKKLNRTRSVGTDLRRRATMRSFSRAVSPASNASSPGTRRHPSLPNSQGYHQKENQDWLVPARFKQPLGPVAPRRASETSVPFVRESSFFNSVPEACSTPVNAKRNSAIVPPMPGRDVDATPRAPLGLRASALFTSNPTSFLLDEPTPRARTCVERTPSDLLPIEDSLFPDSPTIPTEDQPRELTSAVVPLSGPRRLTSYASKDSIFSSLECSTLGTEQHNARRAPVTSGKAKLAAESLTSAPPTSPVAVGRTSPSNSEGDELRDMFSILGLDGEPRPSCRVSVAQIDAEDEHWLASSFSRTGSNSSSLSSVSIAKNARKTKSSASSRKNAKQDATGSKRHVSWALGRPSMSSVSQGPRRRKRMLISKPDLTDELNYINATMTKRQQVSSKVKTILLDKPIQPASDSSDEIDFLKSRVGRGSGSSDT